MKNKNDIPEIAPIKVRQYSNKQSKYDMVARLPCRSVILAPSGGGKGILMQNLCLTIYRGCYERIYLWSPTCNLDQNWRPLKDYIKKELNVNLDKEKCFFDTFVPEEMEAVIKQQEKLAEHQKKQNHSSIYNILIIVDDF